MWKRERRRPRTEEAPSRGRQQQLAPDATTAAAPDDQPPGWRNHPATAGLLEDNFS